MRAVQLPLAGAPGAMLRVAETRHRRDAMARQILAIVVLPQVLLTVLAGVIVRFALHPGLRPPEHPHPAVVSRPPQALRPNDDVSVPAEVPHLVLRVNALPGPR